MRRCSQAKNEEKVVSPGYLWYKARRYSVYFRPEAGLLITQLCITHTDRHMRRGAPKRSADRESVAWDPWRHNPN